MKRREDKIKEWSNFVFLESTLFGHIKKIKKLKINTFTFGAWSLLLVHIWFTPSEGSKAFVNIFLKNLDHEVGPVIGDIFGHNQLRS